MPRLAHRRRLMLLVCLALLSLFEPTSTSLADEPLDFDVSGGHFFKQANGQGGAGVMGYGIVDDDQAKFWSEFQRLGGVDSVGYPSSQRFTWDGFVSQATQRVVLQWHPETGQVAFVNVFDRLHDLGKDDWLLATRQVPKIADWSSDTGKPWETVVSSHLALLDANPAIKAKYYAVVVTLPPKTGPVEK